MNGVTTNYTLDLNVGLTQVLADGTNTYTYGLGRISQTNAVTEYFLGDALGSVRQLTNASGVITYAKSYDPYGVVTSASGTSQSGYGYTGEQVDASGLVYLRARYYNSGIGRFITRDSFMGNTTYPASLNRYSYSGNNPIRYTDPSGNCFDPVTGAICLAVGGGALIGGGINLYLQLHHNGGNWQCVNWGEVGASAGAGAVAGLVGLYAFPVFLPAAGATLSDFVIAGGLSGIVAGQAGRSSYLLFSGHANQIISSFAKPGDVLNDFGWGALGGGVGYGIKGLVEAYHGAMSVSVGVPDEMLSPGMGHDGYYTGEYQPIESPYQCSFTSDTKVATKDGEEPISEIRDGDYVLAYNQKTKTTDYYPVEAVLKHKDNAIVHLLIDKEKITTTPEHPFYTEEKGWVNAGNLQAGMHIRKANTTYGEVKSVKTEESQQEMYNLTVDQTHTFFVGDGQWLVHNTCMQGGISVEKGMAHIEQLRQQYRKGGNLAYAIEDLTTRQTNVLVGASGRYIPGPNPSLRNFPLPSEQQFTTEIVGGWDREVDSEYMILEYIASQANPNDRGTIYLFSQLPICSSCRGVIDQFSEAFPYINLYFNSGP